MELGDERREGRKGPAEARPRRTSASHEARARPLEPSVACEAFFVALGCTAHGVDAPVCAACGNNEPDSVCGLQRCDGPCNRWFCIEGSCAHKLGVSYDKNLTAGDLVCSACDKLEAKLKMKVATATAPRLLQASDDQ